MMKLAKIAGLLLSIPSCVFPAQSAQTNDIAGSIPIQKEHRKQRHQLAKISMLKAIEIATAKFQGTPIEAELEIENGFLVYEIELHNGHTLEIIIDAGNGQILKSGREEAEDDDIDDNNDDDRHDNDDDPGHDHNVSKNQLPKTSLQEALKSALSAKPGIAIEAELERKNGRPIYSIVIVDTDGKRFEVAIDAETGKNIP